MALIRIFAASAVTAGVVVATGRLFPIHASDAVLIARLAVQVGVGTAVYLGLAKVLGIKELRPVARLAHRLVGVSG
jgi:hypothetical protein